MPSIDLSSYKSPKKKKDKEESSFSLSDLLNKDIRFGSSQVSDRKKEAFYLELSTLLQSGIDLKTSLELILVDLDNSKDRHLFDDIKSNVLNGNSLSGALNETGKFSQYEFYSTRIGEETGRLAEVLTDMAKYFKNKTAQRRKVITAVSYPMIVLSTSLGAVFFMLKFVVPMFADVFKRFGGKLPFVTSVILDFSEFTDRNFKYFILLLVISVGLIVFNKGKGWFRRMSSAMILKIPVIGDIVSKIYLARFANTMRLLVSTDTLCYDLFRWLGK